MLSLSLLGSWDEAYIFMKVIHELVHQSFFITLLSREGENTQHTLCIIGDVKFGLDLSDGLLFWLEPENLSISHQSSALYTGFQLHLGLILKYFYSFINHSMA